MQDVAVAMLAVEEIYTSSPWKVYPGDASFCFGITQVAFFQRRVYNVLESFKQVAVFTSIFINWHF